MASVRPTELSGVTAEYTLGEPVLEAAPDEETLQGLEDYFAIRLRFAREPS